MNPRRKPNGSDGENDSMRSSAHVLEALTSDVQLGENIVNLMGTAGAVAATNYLASTSTTATLGQQFLDNAVPGFAIADGVCRELLGLTHIFFAALYTDEQLRLYYEKSKQWLVLQGCWEILRGAPELYYGLQELSGASADIPFIGHFTAAHVGCFGLAITNSLDFLTDALSLAYKFSMNGTRKTERKGYVIDEKKEALKLVSKALEATGWWLLAFGHPYGWVFLAAVALYKLWDGQLWDQVKKDIVKCKSVLFPGQSEQNKDNSKRRSSPILMGPDSSTGRDDSRLTRTAR